MPYVEGQTVHDADSHVMELPGTIERYIAPAYRDKLTARLRWKEGADWAHAARGKQTDPAFRAGAEANLLLRKNYEAMGAFTNTDRTGGPRPLRVRQPTHLHHRRPVPDPAGARGRRRSGGGRRARAHNRMMVDYCSVDRRLLPTAYVPLVDRARTAEVAKEAIALGCKGLMINSRTPAGHSPSHSDFDALWAMAEDAGLPILFPRRRRAEDRSRLFRERRAASAGFPRRSGEFYLGQLHDHSLVHLADPERAGVRRRVRPLPKLKFGAIELGAGWVPSLMQVMDSGAAAFGKEERIRKLSAKPSDILRRQFFATPYPHENVGWIIQNAGEEICMFSSDYPHVEGGRNPLKRFNESLEDVSAAGRRRFFRDNFIEMMGKGLDPALHDIPALQAA